jgi:hypothetical protein
MAIDATVENAACSGRTLGMQRVLVACRGDELADLEFLGPPAHLGHHAAE